MTRDLGDGLRGEIEAMAVYADLLRAERDNAEARASGLARLVETAIQHHLISHSDCQTWENT